MTQYRAWAEGVSQGTLLTSTQSGHYIQSDEPDLVVWAITRAMAPAVVNARMLTTVMLEQGVEAGLALYGAALADAPEGRFDVMLLNEVAFALFMAQRLDDSITVLELNASKYPDEWIAHGSLAQAYMAKGENEKAIEQLRRVLELNPEDQRTKSMLQRLQSD